MNGSSERPGPLAGVRILSLENFLAGNHETSLLGMLGAEIIKIERPETGDALRLIGPYMESSKGKRAAAELRLMMNKRSVAIDLADERGRQLIFDLVACVDIVFANLKPSSLIDMGITFESLRSRNSKIIYSTLSGFGHDDVISDGPFGSWPAFDVIAQGLAGLQFRTESDDPDRPGYNGLPVGDEVTSLISIIGTLSALHRREMTGEAQRVDVAMHDAMIFLNELALGNLSLLGTLAQRGRSQTSAPYGAFRSSDGWINIAIGGDNIWGRFCNAIGRPELIEDPKFRTSADRVGSIQALDEIVEGWTGVRSTDEIVDRLLTYQVPCAPIYTVPEVLTSLQAKARHMFVEVDDPIVGPRSVVGNPIKMMGLSDQDFEAAPRCGQDTVAVLRELLVLGDDAIESLLTSKVIEQSAN
jgi:CoA:oxalate CoA-transferase